MIRWNTDDNTFELGQFLTKKKIKMDRCSLSPNGEFFSYFMFDFQNGQNTMTVISKPPYFTALYLQYEQGTWSGGARFIDNNNIAIKTTTMIKIDKLTNGEFGKFNFIDKSPHKQYDVNSSSERNITNQIHSYCDSRGRIITCKKGILYVDDEEIANFNEERFSKFEHIQAN